MAHFLAYFIPLKSSRAHDRIDLISRTNQFTGRSVMKRFMFLSVGLLCLVLALVIGFEIGSQRAEAQSSPTVVGFCVWSYGSGEWCLTMLSDGSVYARMITGSSVSPGNPLWVTPYPAYYVGNFWEGGVSTERSTWSGVKEQFKK